MGVNFSREEEILTGCVRSYADIYFFTLLYMFSLCLLTVLLYLFLFVCVIVCSTYLD